MKTLNTTAIQNEIRETVATQISIQQEGTDRYRIFTPFCFNDGDHLTIVLKQDNNRWTFSDEGHTLMHLSYEIDEKELRKGSRAKIILDSLNAFGIEDKNGELLIETSPNQFGNALFTFVQGLLKVTDVTFLSRERVKVLFLEDFRSFFPLLGVKIENKGKEG